MKVERCLQNLVHLTVIFRLITTFTCSFPLRGWSPISLYSETGQRTRNYAPEQSSLCHLALHGETTIYDVIRNYISWHIMSSGLLGSPDVHHDLCWKESVRLGHKHISYREGPSSGESGVVNFVSRQHLCSYLATMRAVKSLLCDAIKCFTYLEKLTA